MGAQVEHIAIRSEDPDKLARYYEEVFGWTRLRAGPGGGVHLTDGRINIALLRTNGAPPGIEHFGVKVGSIAEVEPGLVKYEAALQARPPARAAERRIADPEGNQIDLSEKGFMGRS